MWVGTFRWSLTSATDYEVLYGYRTNFDRENSLPTITVNLINSKRKTGVFKKFMSEEKGRKSGFYIPSVSMSK